MFGANRQIVYLCVFDLLDIYEERWSQEYPEKGSISNPHKSSSLEGRYREPLI